MTAHLTRVCILATVASWASANMESAEALQRRVPKQIHTKAAVVETEGDHDPAETHFGAGAEAAHHGHGKYFMYQHVPHKDHYEFGYRRGNDHHFKERYEKAHPHHGHFKTKARWGDKHGGYGEHYWDYNHGGHHGDEGGADDEGGDESDPVPDYHLKGDQEDQEDRVKREHEGTTTARQAGKIRQGRRPSDSSESRDHLGQDTLDTPTYKESRGSPAALDHPGLSLAYDTESGTVVDEVSGRRFLLMPIN